MKTYSETTLNEFKFWAGAIDNKNRFSMEEMEQIEFMLEDCYPDGIDETMVNDIFWFEPETLCEWLGLDFDEWIERPDDYWATSWRS